MPAAARQGASAPADKSAVTLASEEEPPDPSAPKDGPVVASSVEEQPDQQPRGLFCFGPVNCCVLRCLANKAKGTTPRLIALANKTDPMALPGQCLGRAEAVAPTGCACAPAPLAVGCPGALGSPVDPAQPPPVLFGVERPREGGGRRAVVVFVVPRRFRGCRSGGRRRVTCLVLRYRCARAGCAPRPG